MKCQEGILFNHHKEPQELKTEASFEGECQDLFWAGSFCPPRQGRYRLIYEGNIDESWESETSFYQFNFIKLTDRVSPYHYLYEKTCYPYFISHITYFKEGTYGKLISGRK